ncbi:putative desumoylating isopeptidase 2 [Apostichopus japonicus]|uniref:Putative desumoylating isopeptidase 2 n=1 Tax=Stichopus japonicus TaxID=307972 RepID=A0A2G8JUN2_STIJA|nr:putative desumoylating isopeptidase 2 [Apostichopus japonicus]
MSSIDLIELDGEENPALVKLNIYDMYWTNDYTTTIGIGVFHTGVEIFGREFAYGGHPYSISGIFEIDPRDIDDLGPQFRYKETIELGVTDLPEVDVSKVVECLGKNNPGDGYHLIHKNCNHFAEELVQILCNKQIPSWINRLASAGARLPFLEKMLPKEWLTPLALEEAAEHDDAANVEQVIFTEKKLLPRDATEL